MMFLGKIMRRFRKPETEISPELMAKLPLEIQEIILMRLRIIEGERRRKLNTEFHILMSCVCNKPLNLFLYFSRCYIDFPNYRQDICRLLPSSILRQIHQSTKPASGRLVDGVALSWWYIKRQNRAAMSELRARYATSVKFGTSRWKLIITGGDAPRYTPADLPFAYCEDIA